MKLRILPIILLSFLCAASVAVFYQTAPIKPGLTPQTRVASQAPVLQTYGKLPLAFEANQGQTDTQVKFLSRGSGYTLYLTSDEAVLALKKPSAVSRQRSALRNSKFTTPNSTQRKDLRTWPTDFKLLSIDNLQSSIGNSPAPSPQHPAPAVLRMKLVGANSAAKVVGTDELPGKSNYCLGKDPKKWRTDVANYAKVRYKDVYPGVDLVYYGNQGKLEHDFVVSPGANPATIKLAIDGADSLRLDEQGNLVAKFNSGNVILQKPTVYQEVANPEPRIANSKKQSVEGHYVLLADNRIGFDVGTYDPTQPLVIDPVLSYSTYLGGTSDEWGFRIAVDTAGNIYVAGSTTSDDFPTTSGAYQTAYGGAGDGYQYQSLYGDIFVTKLNAASLTAMYSTYIGGSGDENPYAIALDPEGNVYLSGGTNSPDFPVSPDAYQNYFAGWSDVFITKVDATGSSLMYSTYLGTGMGGERGFGLAVDSGGNAYITGDAAPDFPTTPGAYMTGTGGAHVTKVNPTGSGLVYSTHLAGGSGWETWGVGIAVDSSGNAYVVGTTMSSDFPTTAGAFQTAHAGGRDAFVTVFNPTGSALVYSTFLGGTGEEFWGAAIAVDDAGNVYVAGTTASLDFPTTPGAFQTVFGGGGSDFYVAKLNPSLSGTASLVFSTYLGGDAIDSTGWWNGMALDAMGNIHVTGSTGGGDFPVANPIQPQNAGAMDVFVAKLNPAGSALIYSTYLGGTGNETSSGIAADRAGNSYVIGYSDAADFPTTANVLQPTSHGGLEAFVVKILSGPAVALSSGEVDFGGQIIATTSSAKTVTLTNSGGDPLTVSSVSISGEFAQTSDCVKTIAVGENCTLNTTFSPTETGARDGIITISTDAFGSPHTIALSGTGTDFSIAAASGSSDSAEVTAGQAATYTLSVTGTEASGGSATFTCTGAPQAATCSVTPTSVTLSGTTPATVTVSVKTTARPRAAQVPGLDFVVPPNGMDGRYAARLQLLLMLLLALGVVAAVDRQRRTRFAGVALLTTALTVISWTACTNEAAPPPPGTPAGTYTLTVTATSSGASRSTALTLKVN